MKTFKRVFKILISTVLVLLLTVAALVLIVLQWPQLILTEPLLEWAAESVNERDERYDVGFRQADVEVTNQGFLNNRILLQFRDFCLQIPEESFLCHSRAEVGLAYDFGSLSPRITEVGPIRLLDGIARLRLQDLPETDEVDKDPQERRLDLKLPSWLENAEIRPLVVSIPDWQVRNGDLAAAGAFHITSRFPPSQGIEVQTNLAYKMTGTEAAHDTTFSMDLASESGELQGPWAGQFKAAAHSPVHGELNTDVQFRQTDAAAIQFESQSRVRSSLGSANLGFAGELEEDRIAGVLNGTLRPIADVKWLGRPRVHLTECRIEANPGPSQPATVQVKTNCPFEANTTALALRQGAEWLRTFGGQRLAAGRLIADVTTPLSFENGEPIQGQVRVQPDHILSSAARWQGEAAARFRFTPDELPNFRELQTDVDLTMTIAEFQKLVTRLQDTRFAVPAPLHTLAGPVSLRIRDEKTADLLALRSELTTQLQSQYQSLRVEVTSAVRLAAGTESKKPRLSASIDVLLNDLKLSLPPTSDLPPVLPDNRIVTNGERAPAAEPEESPLDVVFTTTIRTAPGQTAEILAPMSEEPIPLALDLKVEEGRSLVGQVQIGEFPIEVLGIERTVEGGRVNMRLTEQKDRASGVLELDSTDRPIEISYAGMAGLISFIPEPKPDLSVGQLLTSLLAGLPLDIAIRTENLPDTPSPYDRGHQALLELHYRY